MFHAYTTPNGGRPTTKKRKRGGIFRVTCGRQNNSVAFPVSRDRPPCRVVNDRRCREINAPAERFAHRKLFARSLCITLIQTAPFSELRLIDENVCFHLASDRTERRRPFVFRKRVFIAFIVDFFCFKTTEIVWTTLTRHIRYSNSVVVHVM